MKLVPPAVLAGRELVVVDVEGNGAQPPEIVEIAALVLTGTTPTTPADMRTWLVRPTQPITAVLTRTVHGISNRDVAHSPAWAEVADEVADTLEGRVLVAHNAAVERRMLGTHLPAWRAPVVLDTLRLAKAVWPGLPGGYSLDNLIDHADLRSPADALISGADPTGSTVLTATTAPAADGGRTGSASRRHRAGYDTWMTAALLVALVTTAALDWPGLLTAAALSDTTPLAPPAPATTADTGATGGTATAAGHEDGGLW